MNYCKNKLRNLLPIVTMILCVFIFTGYSNNFISVSLNANTTELIYITKNNKKTVLFNYPIGVAKKYFLFTYLQIFGTKLLIRFNEIVKVNLDNFYKKYPLITYENFYCKLKINCINYSNNNWAYLA